jgi:hypothetical protein
MLPMRAIAARSTVAAPAVLTLCVAIAAVAVLTLGVAARAGDTATWKQTDGILRINDEPPKVWGVYREGKKTNALILQVDDRLLLIDVKAQTVRELDPKAVTRKEDSIITPAKNPPGKVIASSGWLLRDVGPALRIHFELESESHIVDLELPQWINRGVTY